MAVTGLLWKTKNVIGRGFLLGAGITEGIIEGRRGIDPLDPITSDGVSYKNIPVVSAEFSANILKEKDTERLWNGIEKEGVSPIKIAEGYGAEYSEEKHARYRGILKEALENTPSWMAGMMMERLIGSGYLKPNKQYIAFSEESHRIIAQMMDPEFLSTPFYAKAIDDPKMFAIFMIGIQNSLTIKMNSPVYSAKIAEIVEINGDKFFPLLREAVMNASGKTYEQISEMKLTVKAEDDQKIDVPYSDILYLDPMDLYMISHMDSETIANILNARWFKLLAIISIYNKRLTPVRGAYELDTSRGPPMVFENMFGMMWIDRNIGENMRYEVFDKLGTYGDIYGPRAVKKAMWEVALREYGGTSYTDEGGRVYTFPSIEYEDLEGLYGKAAHYYDALSKKLSGMVKRNWDLILDSDYMRYAYYAGNVSQFYEYAENISMMIRYDPIRYVPADIVPVYQKGYSYYYALPSYYKPPPLHMPLGINDSHTYALMHLIDFAIMRTMWMAKNAFQVAQTTTTITSVTAGMIMGGAIKSLKNSFKMTYSEKLMKRVKDMVGDGILKKLAKHTKNVADECYEELVTEEMFGEDLVTIGGAKWDAFSETLAEMRSNKDTATGAWAAGEIQRKVSQRKSVLGKLAVLSVWGSTEFLEQLSIRVSLYAGMKEIAETVKTKNELSRKETVKKLTKRTLLKLLGVSLRIMRISPIVGGVIDLFAPGGMPISMVSGMISNYGTIAEMVGRLDQKDGSTLNAIISNARELKNSDLLKWISKKRLSKILRREHSQNLHPQNTDAKISPVEISQQDDISAASVKNTQTGSQVEKIKSVSQKNTDSNVKIMLDTDNVENPENLELPHETEVDGSKISMNPDSDFRTTVVDNVDNKINEMNPGTTANTRKLADQLTPNGMMQFKVEQEKTEKDNGERKSPGNLIENDENEEKVINPNIKPILDELKKYTEDLSKALKEGDEGKKYIDTVNKLGALGYSAAIEKVIDIIAELGQKTEDDTIKKMTHKTLLALDLISYTERLRSIMEDIQIESENSEKIISQKIYDSLKNIDDAIANAIDSIKNEYEYINEILSVVEGIADWQKRKIKENLKNPLYEKYIELFESIFGKDFKYLSQSLFDPFIKPFDANAVEKFIIDRKIEKIILDVTGGKWSDHPVVSILNINFNGEINTISNNDNSNKNKLPETVIALNGILSKDIKNELEKKLKDELQNMGVETELKLFVERRDKVKSAAPLDNNIIENDPDKRENMQINKRIKSIQNAIKKLVETIKEMDSDNPAVKSIKQYADILANGLSAKNAPLLLEYLGFESFGSKMNHAEGRAMLYVALRMVEAATDMLNSIINDRSKLASIKTVNDLQLRLANRLTGGREGLDIFIYVNKETCDGCLLVTNQFRNIMDRLIGEDRYSLSLKFIPDGSAKPEFNRIMTNIEVVNTEIIHTRNIYTLGYKKDGKNGHQMMLNFVATAKWLARSVESKNLGELMQSLSLPGKSTDKKDTDIRYIMYLADELVNSKSVENWVDTHISEHTKLLFVGSTGECELDGHPGVLQPELSLHFIIQYAQTLGNVKKLLDATIKELGINKKNMLESYRSTLRKMTNNGDIKIYEILSTIEELTNSMEELTNAMEEFIKLISNKLGDDVKNELQKLQDYIKILNEYRTEITTVFTTEIIMKTTAVILSVIVDNLVERMKSITNENIAKKKDYIRYLFLNTEMGKKLFLYDSDLFTDKVNEIKNVINSLIGQQNDQ